MPGDEAYVRGGDKMFCPAVAASRIEVAPSRVNTAALYFFIRKLAGHEAGIVAVIKDAVDKEVAALLWGPPHPPPLIPMCRKREEEHGKRNRSAAPGYPPWNS